MPELAPLRRRPMQQRSAQRVERMLDACAALVEAHGYDGVTTTLIAERAGVAVGSLYQFFPDKRAVVQALALRNLDRFLHSLTQRFADSSFEYLWEAVDLVIDTYVDMNQQVTAFGLLHFGDLVGTRLLDDERENNAVVTDQLTALISERFETPADVLAVPLSVAVEAADGVLKLAFRTDPAGDPTLIAETKRLVRTYLSLAVDNVSAYAPE